MTLYVPTIWSWKSVAKPSSNKIYFIQSIDRKLPIEDIASAKGLSIEELLEQIETIVESGTKINLDYYINDIIDEYQSEELDDFFKNSEQASFQEAREEFDEKTSTLTRSLDYTESSLSQT